MTDELGWYFNGDAGTQRINDPSKGGSLFVAWKKMDTPLINEVLAKLVRDGCYNMQVKHIRDELMVRELEKPSKVVVITKVTVKGKL